MSSHPNKTSGLRSEGTQPTTITSSLLEASGNCLAPTAIWDGVLWDDCEATERVQALSIEDASV